MIVYKGSNIYSRPLCKAKVSTLFSQGRNLRRHIAAGRSLERHIAAGDFMANKKLYKKERFSGCIVGAAAGDALGSPVKTLTISQIKDLYGKKGILKLSPEKRQKTARISDETQMMLFTAHGILWADAAGLRTGEANCADYVFLALQQWLYSQTGGTSSIDLQWILDDNETGFPCDLLGISAFCKKRNPTKQLVQTLAGIKSENCLLYTSPSPRD